MNWGWVLPGWQLVADEACIQVKKTEFFPKTKRSLWGLQIPQQLQTEGPICMLESSPCFGRLEASNGKSHSLAEVLHFRKTGRPLSKWMLKRGLRTADIL
ncbi:MAG: hypothetical protein FWB81_08165 [Cystobacterineae bacterium]|nr:hypothetical protein [Cystobacterineae bacterium]